MPIMDNREVKLSRSFSFINFLDQMIRDTLPNSDGRYQGEGSKRSTNSLPLSVEDNHLVPTKLTSHYFQRQSALALLAVSRWHGDFLNSPSTLEVPVRWEFDLKNLQRSVPPTLLKYRNWTFFPRTFALHNGLFSSSSIFSNDIFQCGSHKQLGAEGLPRQATI